MSPKTGDPTPQPFDRARLARARWWSAENELYPLVVRDPDLYQAVLERVRDVLAELRATCTRVEDLLDEGSDVVGIVRRTARDNGTRLDHLDPRLIADAARAMRYRELAVQQAPTGESGPTETEG